MGVLVLHIIHLLFAIEASVVATQRDLMERLGSVEALAVARAHLVCVLVLLSSPAGTIPVLAVHCVAGGDVLERVFFEVGVFHLGAAGLMMISRHLFE